MVEKDIEVIWDSEALNDLRKIYNYIKGKSVMAAEKVRNEVFHQTKSIASQPFRHPADKLF